MQIDLWANQARLLDMWKHLHREKQCGCCMTACTLTSLGRFQLFFLSTACCSTRLPPQEKESYYISHIQVWTQEWWAVFTLKLGSVQNLAYIFKKSVIHTVVSVFRFFFFLSDLQSMFVVLSFSRIPSNWSPRVGMPLCFFKYHHAEVDKGKPCFNRVCSAMTLQLHRSCVEQNYTTVVFIDSS